MSSPLDGMGRIQNVLFGASVTLTNLVGVPTVLTAVFRERPIDIMVDDGRPMTVVTPSLSVRRDLVPGIARGWIVAPAAVAPRTFRVLRPWPSGSPASDAFIICELEEIP